MRKNKAQIKLSMEEILLTKKIPQKILTSLFEAADKHIAKISDNSDPKGTFHLASIIDHTLLSPTASITEIEKLCMEALQYHFFAVCVNPFHIPLCRKLLDNTSIKICTVIGFPFGANTTATKVFEAQDAESAGADEIDMVINIGALKDRELELVKNDIAHVVNATSETTVTKVILENAYLTSEEKIIGCMLAKDAGADYVKTSTGFAPSGATLQDVALMRGVVGHHMGIKAAGGIRDRLTAIKMVKAGANRIGASSSVKLVTEDRSI